LKQAQSIDLSTRQKILETTVKLLYAGLPADLTTRKIASAAQVNIAAINYHFRSKDELIDEAVQAATAAAFEAGMKMLMAPGTPAADRLRLFLQGYATGLVRFPGVTRTAWLGLYLKVGGDTFYGRFMKEMLDKLAQVIGEIRGSQDSADITTALMIVSCVIFPFLVSGTVKASGAIDYENDDARRHFIDTALSRLATSAPVGTGDSTKDSPKNRENQNG
jgi:AcrR family transcriptional regulator